MEALVSTGWLAAELADPQLVVLDATVYMPGDARDARKEYAAARIPGARFFDIDRIAERSSGLPHMVPTPEQFAQSLGELGVTNASRVVFYDQLGLFSAARGWWMMKLFGHDRAMVLDGGLPKWRNEERPVQSGPPGPVAPGRFRPDLRPRLLRQLRDMRDNLRSHRELVLDARSADRFYARVREPRPGLRGGHMPGARNIPYTELLADGQTLLAPQALRARFAQAGVDERTEVVTSCGSGLTAAVLNLGLVVAGLPEGALYDGSWAEWGSLADTPVE